MDGILWLLFIFILGGIMGAVVWYAWNNTLAKQRQVIDDKAQQESKEAFRDMAAQALVQNNESFLTVAKETLEKQYAQSAAVLKQREDSIQHLVKPIQETLEKTKQQIQDIEKERRGDYKALDKSIENTITTQQSLYKATTQLAQALAQPTVGGYWGELTLHRLAELSGLAEHCDFTEQAHIKTEQDGNLRPDMIVHLPNNRNIIIDAKTSLAAYTRAFNTTEESERKALLLKHANDIDAQVRNLAKKPYAENLRNALDFVILFLPGDQFLTAALQQKPDLIEEAMKRQVVIATPGSLIALLRTVAYGWREKSMSDNAEKIQELSEEFYERLKLFIKHFQDVGQKLNDSVGKYNKAIGSFDSRLLPKLKELNAFKIHRGQEIPDIKPVEQQTRVSSHFIEDQNLEDASSKAENTSNEEQHKDSV